MPDIDISSLLTDAERLAKQLSSALKAPQHRKQRTLLREGRALLAQCFRTTEAARLAVKEATPPSASDPLAISSTQSLTHTLTSLCANTQSLLSALTSGLDTLPDHWPSLSDKPSPPPPPQPEPPPQLEPPQQPKTPPQPEPPAPPPAPNPTLATPPATPLATPQAPEAPAEPPVRPYFDMVRVKLQRHPAKIHAAHEASVRIGSRALDADELVEVRQARIDKVMEMLGVEARTTQGQDKPTQPYPNELVEGTNERPLVLYAKRKKRKT